MNLGSHMASVVVLSEGSCMRRPSAFMQIGQQTCGHVSCDCEATSMDGAPLMINNSTYPFANYLSYLQ